MVPKTESNTKTDTTVSKQINLPGLNPKVYAYKALLEKNPTPSTVAEAEKFFRENTDALIKLKKDHDFFRVVLKESNVAEEKEKHEHTTELSICDEQEREHQFIEFAGKVHAMWLDLVAPKYEQQ